MEGKQNISETSHGAHHVQRQLKRSISQVFKKIAIQFELPIRLACGYYEDKFRRVGLSTKTLHDCIWARHNGDMVTAVFNPLSQESLKLFLVNADTLIIGSPSSNAMRFYDQIRCRCRERKWTALYQQCRKKYRVRKVCGMRRGH